MPVKKAQTGTKKKHPPPKTRAKKFGRPLKQVEGSKLRAEKVADMVKSVKRKCPDGKMISTPKKRKGWSGAVRFCDKQTDRQTSADTLTTNIQTCTTGQMKQKVSRVTDVLLDEAGGSPAMMSQLVANMNSQRVLKPFLPAGDDSPSTRYGKNVLATLNKCKEHSMKSGSGPDLLRRALVASGAEGPLSTNPVCTLNPVYHIYHTPCIYNLYKYIYIYIYPNIHKP